MSGLETTPAPADGLLSTEPSESPKLTEGAKKAWQAQCAKLGVEDRALFEKHACNGLSSYLKALESACEETRNQTFGFKVLDWLEPLFKVVELLTPPATIAISAYPNPGALVLGGIVGVVQALQRVPEYQKSAVQHLGKMGRKACELFKYETTIYKEEAEVQVKLVNVYGAILAFCQAAFRVGPPRKLPKVKITGVKLSVLRDFESRLGEEVRLYEQHVEDLEQTVCGCDRKRLMLLCDRQEVMQREFGKSLVEHTELLRQQQASFAELERREQELIKLQGREAEESAQRRRLHWLSQMSFRTSYDDKCDEHLEGTGLWLTTSADYTRWKDNGRSDLIWIKGKPGCGKSMLAAVAIADLTLCASPDVGIAYAFCRRGRDAMQNATRILGALVGQICRQQQDNEVLRAEFDEQLSGEPPSARSIRRILDAALPSFQDIFIVIDALDECHDKEILAKHLVDLLQEEAGTRVKVAIFSRHDFNLEQAFQSYPLIQPDSGANIEDLKAYIDSLFPDENSGANEEIRTQVIAKADSTFQWVKLLRQTMQKPLNKKQKLRKIMEIPQGLEAIYDRILEDIWEQDEEIRLTAVLVLLWTTHAKRALNKAEMLEAVADFEDATRVSELCKYDSAEDLVAICANLIFIDRNGCFQLCHETVRGYLEKAESRSPPLAAYVQERQRVQYRLADICLKYMVLDDFTHDSTASSAQMIIWLKNYPFLAYAARFWGAHACLTDNLSSNAMARVLESESRRDLSLQLWFWPDVRASEPPHDSWSGSCSLHLVALFGLIDAAEQFANPVTAQLKDEAGYTPLQYALLGKQRTMVVWLLNYCQVTNLLATEARRVVHFAARLGWTEILDAVLNQESRYANEKIQHDGANPMTEACEASQVAAVERLIQYGADVNQRDGKSRLPLIVAVGTGNKMLVQLLLNQKADPNGCDKDGITPLHYAALAGTDEIVAILLKCGADPSAMTLDENYTPVHYAAEKDAAAIIEALVRVHGPLNSMTKSSRFTPLLLAIKNDALRAVKALVKLGAHRTRTELHWAAYSNNFLLVKFLIDEGWEVEVKDANDDTALHWASCNGTLPMVTCILEHLPAPKRIEFINAKSSVGRTGLHSSIISDHSDIARFLIDHGADIAAVDREGSCPLHLSIVYARLEIANYLIERGADLAAVDAKGRSPLHLSIEHGHVHLAQSLIERGASLTATDERGRTPLHQSFRSDHFELAQYLLDHGADPAVTLPGGETPLHLAAQTNATGLLRPLLLATGNPNTEDVFRDTPLHEATRYGKMDFVQLLIEMCSELQLVLHISPSNKFHLSPLHEAIKAGYDELATLLIEHSAESFPDENGDYPIHFAAVRGADAIVQKLLEKQGNDARGSCQRTPFHMAVICGHLSTAKLLVKYADPNAIDSYGASPLMSAIGQRNGNMAHYLLDLGVDPTTVDIRGEGPLHLAALAGEVTLVRRLLAAGCSADLPGVYGRTALHQAIESGELEIIDMLCSVSPNAVNVADMHGQHCRHLAAGLGYLSILKRLDSQGAVKGSKNKFGWSAAFIAAAAGRLPILQYLHQCGEDLTEEDNSGITPLIIAATLGYWRTVEYLIELQPSSVNRSGRLGLCALHAAASNGHVKTVRVLLAAGADAFSKDLFGIAATDYAVIQRPLLRLMHEAHYFYQSTHDASSIRIRQNSLQRVCQELLSLPTKPTYADHYSYYMQVRILFVLLVQLKDYSAAAICVQQSNTVLQKPLVAYTCAACETSNFDGDQYYCKSCDGLLLLCSRCHEDYLADGQLPKALEALSHLEQRVSVVRDAVSSNLTASAIFNALYSVDCSWKWVNDLYQEYVSWEEEQNATGKFASIKKPGYEFLQILRGLQNQVGNDNLQASSDYDTPAKHVEAEQRFQDHLRRHPTCKDIKLPVCRGHEYFKVTPLLRESSVEWQGHHIFEIPALPQDSRDAFFDPDLPWIRILPAFFQDLINKYGSDEDPPGQSAAPNTGSKERSKLNHSNQDAFPVIPAPNYEHFEGLTRASTFLAQHPPDLQHDLGIYLGVKSSASTLDVSKQLPQTLRRAATLPVKPKAAEPLPLSNEFRMPQPLAQYNHSQMSEDANRQSGKTGSRLAFRNIPLRTSGNRHMSSSTRVEAGEELQIFADRTDAAISNPSQTILASISDLRANKEEAKRKSTRAAQRRTEVYGDPEGKNQIKWFAALFADLIKPGMQEVLLLEEEHKQKNEFRMQGR